MRIFFSQFEIFVIFGVQKMFFELAKKHIQTKRNHKINHFFHTQILQNVVQQILRALMKRSHRLQKYLLEQHLWMLKLLKKLYLSLFI